MRQLAAAFLQASLLAGIAPQAKITASKLAGDKAAARRGGPHSKEFQPAHSRKTIRRHTSSESKGFPKVRTIWDGIMKASA